MIQLAQCTEALDDCWTRIGVWGNQSCPELNEVVHCQNCPVFARAGRRFLDAPAPAGYLEEWAERLAAPQKTVAADLQSVLIFRVADEWLGLLAKAIVEVTEPRAFHRVPYRGGILAGLVNIRGELQLCVRLGQLLGVISKRADTPVRADIDRPRLIVAQRDGDVWVFPSDEVACVHRFDPAQLTPVPPTLERASARFSAGLFFWKEHAVGLLDESRLFDTLRARIR